MSQNQHGSSRPHGNNLMFLRRTTDDVIKLLNVHSDIVCALRLVSYMSAF